MDLYCRNDQQTLKLGSFPSIADAQGYLNTTYLYPKPKPIEFGHVATWTCGAGAQLTCFLLPDRPGQLSPLFRVTYFIEGGRIEMPSQVFTDDHVDVVISDTRLKEGWQVIETHAGAIIVNDLNDKIWVYTPVDS